jgi:hypothetical protein
LKYAIRIKTDWQQYHLANPTVISVWFEKKKGQDAKVLIPSPGYGPRAGLLVAALDIPAVTLNSADALCSELVRKSVYILTTNICGLVTGGNAQQLWNNHQDLAREVARDLCAGSASITIRTSEKHLIAQH